MALFKPKQILQRFDELNIEELEDRGFKAVFIDIDNTITAPNTGSLTTEAKQFLDKFRNTNIKPIIFSNNTKNRVKSFVDDYDIDWYYLCMKPLPFAFIIVAKKYGFKTKECAVLGDQIMTDIIGANTSGCYGIYTKQLVENDTTLTKINRVFEKFIWRYILHEKV